MTAHTLLVQGRIEIQDPGLYVRIGGKEICMWTDSTPRAPKVVLVLTREEAKIFAECLMDAVKKGTSR